MHCSWHEFAHVHPHDSPEPEPRKRPLRDPRPAGPARPRDGAPGLRHRFAEHRQPGRVRLPHARDDAARDDREPALGRRVLPPERHLPGARSGGDAAAGTRRPRRHRRRRVHRQRRERTHRPDAARAARRGRGGAGPEPGLPAVDRCGEPEPRPGGALPVSAGARLHSESGGDRVADHQAHPRDRGHQPEQSHRRGLSAARSSRRSPASPRSTTWSCSRTRSTTR